MWAGSTSRKVLPTVAPGAGAGAGRAGRWKNSTWAITSAPTRLTAASSRVERPLWALPRRGRARQRGWPGGGSARPVPEAGFQRGTFQADGTDIAVGKALDPGIFFAEADAAG